MTSAKLYGTTTVLCGWGAHGRFRDRQGAVRALLLAQGYALTCLGVNADGTPRHPLYVPYSEAPRPWTPRVDAALTGERKGDDDATV